MKSIAFFLTIFLFSACNTEFDNGPIFDEDEVYIVLVNSKGENLFDDYCNNIENIKLYYLDYIGNLVLQPNSYEGGQNVKVIKEDKDSPAMIVVKLSLRDILEDRSITIIDFNKKGRLKISAKINFAGLVGPMAGSIYYSDPLFNDRKVEQSKEGYYLIEMK